MRSLMNSSRSDELIVKEKLVATPSIKIPLSELRVQFARSSGPGGQNVNKTNSKVQLFWNVSESNAIGRALKLHFLQKFANQISKTGELLIESQVHRDQHSNRRECLLKLRDMLRKASRRPKPRTPTKPTKSSVQKRLDSKTKQSAKKKLRHPPDGDNS
jgi:ribosome-associated protein